MPYGTYSLHQRVPGTSNTGLRISANGGDEALANIYQPFWNPRADTVQFNARIRWDFLGLLLGLQCITLMWFVMICRVIAKVLRGEGADDSRSDDEDGEEEDSVPDSPSYSPQTKAMPAFIEVEADPSELSYGAVCGESVPGVGGLRPRAEVGLLRD